LRGQPERHASSNAGIGTKQPGSVNSAFRWNGELSNLVVAAEPGLKTYLRRIHGSSEVVHDHCPGVALYRLSLDEGLDKIKRLLSEASAKGAEIVCFPEAYLPGLRGQDFEVLPFDQTQQERALQAVAQWTRTYGVTTILGTERLTEAGRQIVAFVIDARGQLQGIPNQKTN